MNIVDKKNLLKRRSELEIALINLRSEEDSLSVRDNSEQIKEIETSLELVRLAMDRLDNDMYGFCLICDDEIDRRILSRYPETARCKHCDK